MKPGRFSGSGERPGEAKYWLEATQEELVEGLDKIACAMDHRVLGQGYGKLMRLTEIFKMCEEEGHKDPCSSSSWVEEARPKRQLSPTLLQNFSTSLLHLHWLDWEKWFSRLRGRQQITVGECVGQFKFSAGSANSRLAIARCEADKLPCWRLC